MSAAEVDATWTARPSASQTDRPVLGARAVSWSQIWSQAWHCPPVLRLQVRSRRRQSGPVAARRQPLDVIERPGSCPDPGQQRQDTPPPTHPRRRPRRQQRPLHRCAGPAATRRAHPRLRRPPHRRRAVPPQDHPRPPALRRPRAGLGAVDQVRGAMLEALLAGQTDPHGAGRAGPRPAARQDPRPALAHIDFLDAAIAELDTTLERPPRSPITWPARRCACSPTPRPTTSPPGVPRAVALVEKS
jgi:hypothetical protein